MTNHPNRKRDLPPLAAALKSYRARRGLTVRELAAEWEIPIGTLNDMEQPARSPETHLANIAARALNQLAPVDS